MLTRQLRHLCPSLLLLFVLVGWSSAAERPNFVIFIADDIGWNDIGVYGNSGVRTPHVDQLASQGMRFDAAFLTCSSCSPSRCSIMTGRYPHSTGAGELHQPLPANQTTFAALLREAGYYTASAGKWHLGNPARSGFDRIEGGRPSGCEKWVEVVRERPRDKPFFFWFAASDAHRSYQPGAVDPPHKPADVTVPPFLPDLPATRGDLALYYDEVSRLDSYVGKVLAELSSQDVDQNTLVIYMSDNGRPFPRSKTTLYDSGVQTPFVARWPQVIQPGSVNKTLISSVDIAPTLLELAGLELPDSFQGHSLQPTLKDPAIEVRDHVIAEHNWHDYSAYKRSVRTRKYLYIYNGYPQFPGTPPADAVRSPTYVLMQRMRDAGTLPPHQWDCFISPRPAEELYDVEADPYSLTNLASDPGRRELLASLQGQLKQWQIATADAPANLPRPDGFHREAGTRIKLPEPVTAGDALPAIPKVDRHIPPAGIEVPAEQLDGLVSSLQQIQQGLDEHRDDEHYTDVAVFTKAVAWAIKFGEFYKAADVETARSLLAEAERRHAQLDAGQSDWTSAPGRVVRGYRSSIDGSLQPYGLEIPEDLALDKPVPLYVWLHGRGDKITDMHFIAQRMTRAGRIAPAGAIVLHPFGRHCMGFKSAGEIDVLDAVADVQRRYNIDSRRIVLAGFSMGGAGAWHVGAHYADRWVAVSPGAGFAETALYNKLTPEKFPPDHVQLMWGMYDVPGYVRNLFNVPVIAYSGELDKQIQAARVMEEAYLHHGRKLTHIIGPGMGHSYHKDSLVDILSRLAKAVDRGQVATPTEVHLQTRTLRYNKVHWVQALRLEHHWQEARIDARIIPNQKPVVEVTTQNVTMLELTPFEDMYAATISVNGRSIKPPGVLKLKAPARAILSKGSDGEFHWLRKLPTDGLAKRHGLQGPIDDAFLSPFLVVVPSGTSSNPLAERWVEFELDHFLHRWESLYRGHARVKPDKDVTAEDIQQYNLVLWGTPDSNSLIHRLTSLGPRDGNHALPIQWSDQVLQLGNQQYDASTQMPILVYPNPLNPDRYVVINSGPTHREGHDRTNSLQNPKLLDWAIIDMSQLPDRESAGKLLGTGLFDESWQLR